MFIPPTYSNITFVISRTGDTDPYTSSFGVASDANFDPAQATSLATALRTATLPNLSTGDTLVSIDFDYNDGAGVLPFSIPQGQVGTGSPLSAVAPQNVAVLIQKRTSTPGRKGRGRMFWPYVPEVDVDAVGTFSPTGIARMNTMLGAWKSAIVTNTAFSFPVLFHTTSTPDPSEITAFVVSPIVATQRRRLRR